LTGLQTLIYLAAPIAFLFTGVLPVRSLDTVVLAHVAIYLIVSRLLTDLQARRFGAWWVAQRSRWAGFAARLLATAAYFRDRSTPSSAMPSPGDRRTRLGDHSALLWTIAATLLAILWAAIAISSGLVAYPGDGWTSLPFLAGLGWAVSNVVV